jgi:TolB-like protein/Flp pilus assembly protein TadD
MNDAAKAVFLSYASQDAEAAQKICTALRAVGIEVWFDRSELVGGDAWDQKIRGQIGTCALFIPIISATTQARPEGYFRLEWRLADQRTHLMGRKKAFLVPVCVDDTPDADADVPDSFTQVQWTRLPRGETPVAFAERVKKLAAGEPARDPRPESGGVAGPAPSGDPRPKRWLAPVLAAAGVVLVTIMVSRPWEKVVRPPAAAAPVPAAPGDAADLSARAFALTQKLSFTRDDLATAESLAQRATEVAPDSGRAWSVSAWVQASYLMRNWDRSEKRRQDTQAFANHALALGADDADALNSLGEVYEKQGAPLEQEKLARRAVAADPRNFRSRMELGRALGVLNRIDEARAVLRAAVDLDPNNVLAHYELANSYAGFGFGRQPESPAEVALALEQFSAALALQPFASGLLAKAVLLAARRGDFVGMRTQLDQMENLPLTERTSDRSVYVAMLAGLWEHRPDRVYAAAALTARTYFDDTVIAAPKSWLTALAYRQEGKENSARQEWKEAELVLRQRLAEYPGDRLLAGQLAATLAWLGRNEEADREIQPVELTWREQPDVRFATTLARYYAARGDATKAASYLRPVLGRSSFLTDYVLPVDPWWDKLRGQPEFDAVLQEAAERIRSTANAETPNSKFQTPNPGLQIPDPKSQIPDPKPETANPGPSTPAAVDTKSIAVLAFTNLSDDKANEYFSEGISEELLNVLAKIPGLKVTARTSAFYFKGKEVPIPEIAKQLGVAYVVEGSVQRAVDKVKIVARLTKAADGFQVWSDTFVRDARDVFAVEDEIAGLVATQLSLKVGASPAASAGAVDPRAFELYLQARQAWNLRNAEAYTRADRLLRQVLAIAPNFARAHAALADVWLNQSQNDGVVGTFRQRGAPELARVVAKAGEALALDPASAEAHASLGQALKMSWRFAEAERELRRAVALNPSYATAHQWLSRVLGLEGGMDEALAELKLASALDPLSARILDNYALQLYLAGRPGEAVEAFDRALALQPNSPQSLVNKAWALVALGRFADAATLALALPADQSRFVGDQIIVLGRSGRKAEALRLQEKFDAGLDPNTARSAVLLALGRTEEALAALDPTTVPATFLPTILFDSLYDPIRDDPRFRQFLLALGLTEAHARAQAWRAAHPPDIPEASK